MDSKPQPSIPHSTKPYHIDNDISKLQHKTYQDDNIDENLSNEISDYNYQYQDTTVPPLNNYICPSCSCQCYQLKHYHNNNFNSINNSLSLHPTCIHCGSLSKPSDHVHPHPHENIYDTPSSGKNNFSPLTHFTNHSECNLTPFYGHQAVSSTPKSNQSTHQIRLKKKMHQHHYHYKTNSKFGYSKFSIEIRCLNASSRKTNEDVMKRVSLLEEKLSEKESTINNLLNNIMFLENQLNNYRNENESLKSNKHAVKRTNNETTHKNKKLEDIIKQLKQDNKLLEQENKNLKVDNVTLYQMVQDKTITHPPQQHIIQRDAPPIQPIFIKQNFLNNKEDDTANQESEQEQEDAPNIQVIDRNYSSHSHTNNNNKNVSSGKQFTRQQQVSYQPSISVNTNENNTNQFRAHTEVNKGKHDVSNMESFQECEENPLTTSRAGNDGNNSDNTSSDVNYHNKIKDIKQHIASLNSGISSSRNIRQNNNNNSGNHNDKMKYETVHVEQHSKTKLEPITEPNMPLQPQKTASNPFHIEINKSENESQICMHKQTLSPIFTLYDKKRVLCFDPETKTFSLIEFSDLSQQFENHFKPEGSLYLSLNNSLYIITGSYFDTLYHFNLNERTLRKISHLNHNHCKGGFIYLYSTNEFLCISGTSNKYIETCGLLSNHKRSCSNSNNSFSLHPKNKTSHHWALLANELTIERSQSMFIVQNNKYIFAFFGFCYPQNRYLNSIEYCEIQTNSNNACKLGKWKLIQVVANVENISLHLKGHFIFAIGSSQENEEGLIVLGGVDGKNNTSVMNYIEIGFEEGEDGLMVNIRPINKNIVDINVNKVYFFNQGVPACAFSKSYGSILLFDQAFNVHMINREELSHDIYYFE